MAQKTMEELEGEVAKLKERLAAATELARSIHQEVKRGPATDDHGLIGNLSCALDHLYSARDPKPL